MGKRNMNVIEWFFGWSNTRKKASSRANSYGCVMLELDFPGMEAVQSNIFPQTVYGNYEEGCYGLVKVPHVSLIYGLHDVVSTDDVKKILSDVTFGECVIEGLTVFRNRDYDVLKFDAMGDGIMEANRKLRVLPHTSDYPDFIPHLTVGYVNSGTGEVQADSIGPMKFVLRPKRISYENSLGEVSYIEIKN